MPVVSLLERHEDEVGIRVRVLLGLDLGFAAVLKVGLHNTQQDVTSYIRGGYQGVKQSSMPT